jgi:hypothetical protein
MTNDFGEDDRPAQGTPAEAALVASVALQPTFSADGESYRLVADGALKVLRLFVLSYSRAGG